jgi:branched-chain amino acid transport system substrate-binding protein
VVTLVSDFSPGHEAEARFKDRYLASGGEVVESIRVPLQNPDFAPFLQRARDYSPQAIFVFIPSVQAATFAKQFAERGLDKAGIRLIGPGDITDDELLPVTGDAMLGTLTAHFYSAAHPSPMNMAFVDAYRKLTGNRANFMAVSGYDGMHLIYAVAEEDYRFRCGRCIDIGDERYELGKSPRPDVDRSCEWRRRPQHLYPQG